MTSSAALRCGRPPPHEVHHRAGSGLAISGQARGEAWPAGISDEALWSACGSGEQRSGWWIREAAVSDCTDRFSSCRGRSLPRLHFPIGLPPFVLDIEKVPSGTSRPASIAKPGSVYLSDGGVIENLGVQTLLRSRGFGSWDIIQSDAGALVLMGRAPFTAIGRSDAGLVYWVDGHSNESWIS